MLRDRTAESKANGQPLAKAAQLLNEAQSRRVRTTLAHVEKLLADALQKLGARPGSPELAREIADAAPLQRHLTQDYAAKARGLMRNALERLRVAVPPPEVSAVRAAQVALRYAEIAASELTPEALRGYGTLSQEAARELNSAVGALVDLLQQMEGFLAQGAGGDLEARLRRLDRLRGETLALGELARVVRAHGLLELRPALEALTERAESRDMEVALFGRVNGGKSSLLNFLLGEDVLPVGATPVSAVPVAIVHGLKREGRAWFADAAPQVVGFGRLAEFASENQNPSNARHVTQLRLYVPAKLLARGVRLIDSPGYGALSDAGADAALAYLPRCDLGLVLIEAGATPSAEDAAVVSALLRAGAEAAVLLTKADLLADDDALGALIYARRALASATGTEVPVHLVSVKGAGAAYARRWLEDALAPCIERAQALRQSSLRRKIAALREDVLEVLQRALAPGDAAPQPARLEEAEDILRDALEELDRALARRAPAPPYPARRAHEVVSGAAYNAALILRSDPTSPNDLTPVLVAATKSAQAASAELTAREVGRLRAVLANALARAAGATAVRGADEDELPRAAGLPVANVEAYVPRWRVKRPRMLVAVPFVLEPMLRRRLRRAGAAAGIERSLADYGRRLDGWRTAQLQALRTDFVARADRLRALTAGAPEHTARAVLESDLARLRALGAGEDAGPPQAADHARAR
ncbi:MAG: dynamin family protein [Betaproteobacteria bacterium]|nr:dynamin family protein [Betaproteobacteria bacterium]